MVAVLPAPPVVDPSTTLDALTYEQVEPFLVAWTWFIAIVAMIHIIRFIVDYSRPWRV